MCIRDRNQIFTVGDDGSVEGSTSYEIGDPPPAVVGSWKLMPSAGALKVGPGVDDGSWWSSSAADVETRACLFDDEYVFHADGTFENVHGTETWIEPWQGTDPEACGAPVAPHNGSVSATWSIDETAGTITLTGVGAYLGLAKAYNGGELGSPSEAPESVTYTILNTDIGIMSVYIQSAGAGTGYWSFSFVNDDYQPPVDPDPVTVTFQLDTTAGEWGWPPYVTGSFDGWSGWGLELTHDGLERYSGSIDLMPGEYEYKFVCGGWADQETVPEECNDGNGDEFSNRLVVVPEDEEWIEADVTSWSGCPEPDPCDIVDCSNLHFAGVMEPGLINYISGELGFTADSVASLIQLGEVSMGVYSTWGDPDTATYMPEFSDPQDSIFLYLVEYPDGIPDTAVYYLSLIHI